MWGIGLKAKFIIVLFLSLVSVSSILFTTFTYYFNQEKIKLIDIQLRETALALVNSELSDLKKINFDKAEELISEELGHNRVGKLFYIRNVNDEIIFQSRLATVAQAKFSRKPKIYTTTYMDKQYRVLNLDLPKVPDRTLQIAAVLDPDIYTHSFSKEILGITAIAIFALIFIAYFLSKILLKPMDQLSTHMRQVNRELNTLGLVNLLPQNLKRMINNRWYYRDEFSNLLKCTELVLEKINFNFKMTKPWSYQMAHEIKTPLSIIKIDLEKILKPQANIEELKNEIEYNIKKIDLTISQFLEWASLNSISSDLNLFAIRPDTELHYVCKRLNEKYHNRINLEIKSPIILHANPEHLVQMFNNLIENALKYSTGLVEVKLSGYNFSVIDYGPGIPNIVLERIGLPFNRGTDSKQKSTGLGLAWVNTITQMYNWNIKFLRESERTIIEIEFPKLKIEDK